MLAGNNTPVAEEINGEGGMTELKYLGYLIHDFAVRALDVNQEGTCVLKGQKRTRV